MDVDERIELVCAHTEEVVSREELEQLFVAKESPHAYMGFAPTGMMHIGHMVPIRKIADFLNAGCRFTFLVADLHAFLDDNKSPWELLDDRFTVYKQCAVGVLKAFGAPLDKVEFVRGSDFEFLRDYQEGVLQMIGETTLSRAQRAASEVVRFGDSPKLGGFVYPFYQVEDVYALDADIALGGIDQRGIYMLGRELADKLSRRKYVCVFTPLLPGLTGDKMSASDETSKVGLLDSEAVIRKKLSKAFCPAGEVEGNGVLAFLEHVVFAVRDELVISRPEKFGGDVTFSSYSSLEEAFVAGEVHPLDLKNALADVVVDFLAVVGQEVSSDVVARAYPE